VYFTQIPNANDDDVRKVSNTTKVTADVVDSTGILLYLERKNAIYGVNILKHYGKNELNFPQQQESVCDLKLK